MFPRHKAPRCRGLTLVEMLMASGIMGILAVGIAGLAVSVEQGSLYNAGRTTSAQHARVVFDRIGRMVSTATAAGGYPGAVVVYDQIGTNLYPDTLIIWHPSSTPANAAGPPLVSELVFYCPDPAAPTNLVELTAPTNTQTFPLDSATLNTSTWRSAISAIKTSSSSQKVLLSDLLRTASSSGGSGLRGAVRFYCDLHPTATEWSNYQAGTLAWTNIAWPQGLFSTAGGLRQAAVRVELELMPDNLQGQPDPSGQLTLPFFSSTSLYYQVGP